MVQDLLGLLALFFNTSLIIHYRAGAFCGIVFTDENMHELLVGGGETFSRETEIFSLSTQSWRSGPDLPHPVVDASYVQLHGSILVIGGQISSGVYSDKIHQYDASSSSWITLPQRLAKARSYACALKLI